MAHRVLINATGKPMKHPSTGQTIMPGQAYTEPEDMEQVELTELAESNVIVQTVADPKATQQAIAKVRRSRKVKDNDDSGSDTGV